MRRLARLAMPEELAVPEQAQARAHRAQRMRRLAPQGESGPRARARSCPSAPRGGVHHPPNPRDGGWFPPARGSPRWSGLGRYHSQTLSALPEKRACLEA